MGLTYSTPEPNSYKNPTSAEIKNNVDNLFRNRKTNSYSEATFSLGGMDDTELEPKVDGVMMSNDVEQESKSEALPLQPQIEPQPSYITGGGNKKFNSKKHRYLKYDVEKFLQSQGGDGNKVADTMNEDLKEMDEYLGQSGGLPNEFTTSPTSLTPQTNFFAKLKGGGTEDDDNDDDDDIEDDDIEDFDNIVEDEDEDEDDEDEDKDKEDNENKNKTDEKKKKKKLENESESSFNNSPDMNIVPFYSPDSSEKAHPYLKNRFNK